MSVEEYKRRERDLKILRLLVQGEKEIAAGKGFELDDIQAKADAIFDGSPDPSRPKDPR